jgi:hypothetical protein
MGEEETREEKGKQGRGIGEERRGEEGTEQGTDRKGRGAGCYEFSNVIEGMRRKSRGREGSCLEGFGEGSCGEHFPCVG